MASENGNAHAFDRASVHPAFGNHNVQLSPSQTQAFATESEIDPGNLEATWEAEGSNCAVQTLTSQQLAMPSFSAGSTQQQPYDALSPSMLQDESRASNRFRNTASSSVFLNNEPVQTDPLRSEVRLAPRPYTGYENVTAPSSFYTDIGPARPHPPRTDVSPAAALPPPAPLDSARGDPSRRSRPDAAVSNPYPRPQDNRPVIQDQPSAGLPYRSGPGPSGNAHRPATPEETLRWERQNEIVERPTFTEYYENKRRPKPMPPSGRRQFYGRRPSPPPPPPQPQASTSRPQSGPPTVTEADPTLTMEEVRLWARARGPVAPSDVSTVWPQDSISSVGLRR
ncbi:hypothetical protein LZ30DRAFT_606929 [Colletotrichum cereale]|nr:hypothetical protein LZ30DRAFT_606929 [Colletotrichum cereale]